MRKLLLAAIAALALLAPAAANAQDLPSYAQPDGGGGDQQIRGRIATFDGAYSLTVRDDRGFIDSVELHNGTIINPTGLTLAPGMVVSILGYNAGPYFGANEVDTPYQIDYGVPYYLGHPWNYYGPSIGLGFYFGNAGWWHGGYFRGGYRYVGGARIYSGRPAARIYGGGRFEGRNYVAPASRGGYAPRGAARGGGSHSGHPGHFR
jgi:hypothetical protein